MLPNNVYKTTPSSRILIGVSSVCLIAFAAYNWIVSPQTVCLKAAQQQYHMLQNSGKKAMVIRAKVSKKEREITDLKDSLEVQSQYFFTTNDAREFFYSVETMLEEAGCSILALTYINTATDKANKKEEGGISPVTQKTAKLRFSGSYAGLMQFLGSLDDMPQEVVVRDILMSVDQLNKGKLECSMKITINILQDREALSDG
ncbi:hypothetical protein STSP2_02964 [Anaerohalosphaera lusitana]|uniref:Pilus assembly protein, PilO n=1 Tax=Anaerohalosphaera lusitana TaxID=1936003 RepID=A0A1U9NPQ5_9BACT|nr:hypothetical protein [Anaerohalosphaera lusitana]AQT69767.1 hypothetical protein STSP2_02964 [Anaerohalosphaera lusitana]